MSAGALHTTLNVSDDAMADVEAAAVTIQSRARVNRRRSAQTEQKVQQKVQELATLRSPFQTAGLNFYVLGKKIMARQFEPIQNFSAELVALVDTMLQVKAEDRASAGDVHARAAAAASATGGGGSSMVEG